MIDFLKILVVEKSEIMKLNNDSRLIWIKDTESLKNDMETIQTTKVKTYNGILFCFYEHKVEILFKPHYYFNGNRHNANDFNASTCMSLILLIDEFTDIKTAKVINLEFGVNFISDYGKELILCIEYHKKDQFLTDTGLKFSRKSFRANKNGIANKYKIIKIYSKGVQFPEYCDLNTIRIEIKSKKSKYINTLGIYTVSDLLNPKIYEQFKDQLLQVIDNLLILDHKVSFEKLNKRDAKKLTEYLKNYGWYHAIEKTRSDFLNKKKRYFALLDKTGFNIHTELKNIVKTKLSNLLKTENETCANSPPNEKTKRVHIPLLI